MTPLSDNFLSKWEHIIAGVDPTNVPLECIQRLIIKLHGRRRKTVNLTALRKQGLTEIEIQAVINRQLAELEDSVVNVSFYVDVELVAEMVQPVTESVLKEL